MCRWDSAKAGRLQKVGQLDQHANPMMKSVKGMNWYRWSLFFPLSSFFLACMLGADIKPGRKKERAKRLSPKICRPCFVESGWWKLLRTTQFSMGPQFFLKRKVSKPLGQSLMSSKMAKPPFMTRSSRSKMKEMTSWNSNLRLQKISRTFLSLNSIGFVAKNKRNLWNNYRKVIRAKSDSGHWSGSPRMTTRGTKLNSKWWWGPKTIETS